jgi:hypothetical protein
MAASRRVIELWLVGEDRPANRFQGVASFWRRKNHRQRQESITEPQARLSLRAMNVEHRPYGCGA